MGIYVDPEETIFGFELCNMQTLWDTLKIEKVKTREELRQFRYGVKRQLDPYYDFKRRIRENIVEFWTNFGVAYAEKYPEMKRLQLKAFIGTKSGLHPDVVQLDNYDVIFGQEVNEEMIFTADNVHFQMQFDLSPKIKDIMRDFIAFNVKYGKNFVEPDLKEESFSGYEVIPDEEGEKLFDESKITLPSKAGIHKFVHMG